MSAELPTNPETPSKALETGKADVLGAAVVQSAPPKRKGGPGIPKGTKLPPSKLLKTVDGKSLIPDMVQAALGAPHLRPSLQTTLRRSKRPPWTRPPHGC